MSPRQRPSRVLPTLWLMTDERVTEDRLLRAAWRLPRGGGIVFRHYSLPDADRRILFNRLRRIAMRRGLTLFLAGDAGRAAQWGADGSHGRGAGRRNGFPLSMPVHTMRELRGAQRAGAALIFLSPLFATRSHPGGRSLGASRFAALARRSNIPVMALGGVSRRHMRLIRALGASGFGAIDGLSG